LDDSVSCAVTACPARTGTGHRFTRLRTARMASPRRAGSTRRAVTAGPRPPPLGTRRGPVRMLSALIPATAYALGCLRRLCLRSWP
jgi:hypothetical protein